MLSAHLKRVDRSDEALPLGRYPLCPAYPLAAPVDRVDAGERLDTHAPVPLWTSVPPGWTTWFGMGGRHVGIIGRHHRNTQVASSMLCSARTSPQSRSSPCDPCVALPVPEVPAGPSHRPGRLGVVDLQVLGVPPAPRRQSRAETARRRENAWSTFLIVGG